MSQMTEIEAEQGWKRARIAEIKELMSRHNLSIEDLHEAPPAHIEVLYYDAADGSFYWAKNTGKRDRIGMKAGHVGSNGYRMINFKGKKVLAHRLAWLYVYGKWPENQIDHINGKKDDNRIANLRDVTLATNKQNARVALANNKTKLLGVSEKRGKFVANIKLDGKAVRIGTFETAEEAHAAYIAAKRELHQGCTI